VSGDLIEQGLIGEIPPGADPRISRLDVQYGPKSWNGFSIDAQLENNDKGYADSANTLALPTFTTLNLGARYRFDLFDAPATLRVRVQNVTNAYGWELQGGNNLFFSYIGKRRYSISLAADF